MRHPVRTRGLHAESVEKLSDNMAEIRPTIMTAVPRLYEAMHQRILRGIAKASPLQRRMVDMAVALGRKRCRGEALGFGERIGDLVAEATVRRKVSVRQRRSASARRPARAC